MRVLFLLIVCLTVLGVEVASVALPLSSAAAQCRPNGRDC
jgi:hypothetical protein